MPSHRLEPHCRRNSDREQETRTQDPGIETDMSLFISCLFASIRGPPEGG
jgi:hypothetical protein